VANIKQQIKRIRKNEEARQRNKAVKSRIKTAIRRYREAVEAGDSEQATTRQREAARLLDKAVSKGVIHKNQAANKKSRMAHRAERFTVDAKAGKTPA
jgi:small subunit ribosomal protein S20